MRRYREHNEEVKRNQEAAREMALRLYPDMPLEEPAGNWGDEHDKKLAAMRQQSSIVSPRLPVAIGSDNGN